jgi:hypothetical protein
MASVFYMARDRFIRGVYTSGARPHLCLESPAPDGRRHTGVRTLAPARYSQKHTTDGHDSGLIARFH